MGLVYPGIPKLLIDEILRNFSIKYFIETGTYLGETAVWASQRFEKVFTIERSDELWKTTKNKFGHIKNIDFLLGDSREKIIEIKRQLNSTALFWLDAHWSMGNTYGEGDECALIDELKSINEINQNKFILIDDARLFLFPPPHPYSILYWPNLAEVFELLPNSKYYSVIIDDVIVAIPVFAKPIMVKFYQDYSTHLWELHLTKKSKEMSKIAEFFKKIKR